VTLCAAWATEADLPDSCDATAIKPATLEEALWYASTILYNLTQRRFPGECTDTYTPFNRCRSGRCSCVEGMLELPSRPVTAITSVVVDGVTLDASEYVVHDKRYLRRVGIASSWPCGCDIDDEEYFVVDYVWGREPTRSLVRAAALLAWEYAVAWTPDCAQQCRLPKRITSITREGVTMAVVDSLALFKDGMTGLPDVDALIQSEAFGQSRQRPIVAVPGAAAHGTRV
jgi:hypothetical protein